MKKCIVIALFFLIALSVAYSQSSWLRVNQIGYLENDVKAAVWVSKENKPITESETVDDDSKRVVYFGYLTAQAKKPEKVLGGIVRGNPSEKKIALVFTGHEFADGGNTILKTLKKQNVKGSFFLTGDFYRKFASLTRNLQKQGHYLAPHSDKHLLYADWDDRSKTLVSKDEFEKDLNDNYAAMQKAGVKIAEPRYYMPPFEWYNQEISDWAKPMNVQIVNFTPGTTSNADYTTPDMTSYRSSDEIYNNIMKLEESANLNGFMMLVHIGTDPKRTDKFYNRLDNLIKELKKRGYEFVRVDELLGE